jgi:hypothetical protein
MRAPRTKKDILFTNHPLPTFVAALEATMNAPSSTSMSGINLDLYSNKNIKT